MEVYRMTEELKQPGQILESKEKRIGIWIVVAFIVISIFFVFLGIIKKSLNWFLWPFLIMCVLGIITGIIYLINKKIKNKNLEAKIDLVKKSEVNNSDCRILAKRIIEEELEDNVVMEGSEVVNAGAGNIASYKTPVFHSFGKGYYDGFFHIFINMNNARRYSAMNGPKPLTSDEVERTINNLAEVPVEEDISTQTIFDPISGRTSTTESRKRQTKIDKIIEEHEQKEEENKII
jgi:hypothetical protein